MHCEYCNKDVHNAADIRRHILTIEHVRNKRSYDLSKEKYIERRRQALIHPKNFQELATLLNMHSGQDVNALYDNGFFKINNQWHCEVAEELVQTLQDSGIHYQFQRLPQEIRQPLNLAFEMEEENKRKADQQKQS